MKHQEAILTFDKQVETTLGLIEGLNPPNPEFFDLVKGNVFVGQRARLEGDSSYRQLLPYALFSRTLNGVKEYLVYSRTSLVGESRLIGKASIGIGGHVDAIDIIYNENKSINLKDTIFYSSHREFEEELKFKDLSALDDTADQFVTLSELPPPRAIRLTSHLLDNTQVLGYLIDNSNTVGEVHFGYILEVALNGEYDAIIGETELEMIGWMTADQLKISHLSFENWSKILIDSL
jgi:predicted NUDIX family phosphoesterase